MSRCPRGLHLHHVLTRPSSRRFHINTNPLVPRIQVVSQPPEPPRPIDQNHHWTVNSQEPSSDCESTRASLFDVEVPHAAPPADGFDASYKREKLLLERNLDFNLIETRIIKAVIRTEDWINQQRHLRGLRHRVKAYFVGDWVRDKILGRQNPHISITLDCCDPRQFIQTMIEVNGFRYKGRPLANLAVHPPVTWEKNGYLRWGPRVWAQKYQSTFGGKNYVYTALVFFVAKYIVSAGKLRVLSAPQYEDVNNDGIRDWDSEIEGSSEATTFPDVRRRQNLWLSQDALVRDLTINAIYLPVKPLQLLDPRKRGFKDLESRIIRTPRNPMDTLLEDPTRILRVFILSGRLSDINFQVDEKIIEAMKEPEIRVFPLFACMG